MLEMTLFPEETSDELRSLPVGTEVGARRWPDQGVDYGTPWKGVVLAINDPRAWAGSVAFGPGIPSQEAVDRHVEWCLGKGYLRTSIPVLWAFREGPKVYWEGGTGDYAVRPYVEDVAAWTAENARREAEFAKRMLYRSSSLPR